ncbi:MAG: putative sulfate/molybdate transporter [Gemmatimonadota bacterium]|nr:putative sulfate/molybdate transporter [Gemmatimonadota bacterium]
MIAESEQSPPPATVNDRPRMRFDRNELAGAFGDIGTDLPLIIGMILAAGLDSASVLIMFGLMQVFTAATYGIPIAVQPLKAVAVIVITQRVAPELLYGGGLAIGVAMLLLTVSGGIDWLARVVPRAVVRGLQLGLGLQLALLALRDYVQRDGPRGYVLAAAAFVIVIALLGNRRFPPALFVIGLGILYAIVFNLDPGQIVAGAGFSLPTVQRITLSDIVTGFVLLAIPQIPLSLGNSVLATRQIAEDLFPERRITVRKLGVTYAAMNLVNPWLGGVPTCHGSGGLAGHYTFGARTGGSLVIYGSIYLAIGLFFSGVFRQTVQVFPLPMLGVLLLFEGLVLMSLVRGEAVGRWEFFVVLTVGVIAVGLPYGYAIALVVGTALYYFFRRQGLLEQR